jgi:hypothetical protein
VGLSPYYALSTNRPTQDSYSRYEKHFTIFLALAPLFVENEITYGFQYKIFIPFFWGGGGDLLADVLLTVVL